MCNVTCRSISSGADSLTSFHERLHTSLTHKTSSLSLRRQTWMVSVAYLWLLNEVCHKSLCID